jgi:hypothetical protein
MRTIEEVKRELADVEMEINEYEQYVDELAQEAEQARQDGDDESADDLDSEEAREYNQLVQFEWEQSRLYEELRELQDSDG